jgi:hypothetical protein
LRPLSSGRPKILAHVAGIQVFGTFFIVHGFLDCVDLLSVGEFNSGGAWGTGLGGLRSNQDVCLGWCCGFVGVNSGVGVIDILWAIVCHVALEVAPEAPALLGKLSAFLWGKFLELSGISSVNVHRDMIQI